MNFANSNIQDCDCCTLYRNVALNCQNKLITHWIAQFGSTFQKIGIKENLKNLAKNKTLMKILDLVF